MCIRDRCQQHSYQSQNALEVSSGNCVLHCLYINKKEIVIMGLLSYSTVDQAHTSSCAQSSCLVYDFVST